MTARIQLTVHRQIDGEAETTQLETDGRLTALTDGFQVRYRELPEQAVAGAAVCVTVRPQRVTVERRGETVSRLLLVPGRRCLCRYETPYGALTLHAQCTALRSTLTGQGGRVFVAYRLEWGEGEPGRYTMEILVKEVSA